METYRVGIIGCGGIARDHARAYGKIQNVKLVAGSEIDPERRAKFAEDFGLQNSESCLVPLDRQLQDLLQSFGRVPAGDDPLCYDNRLRCLLRIESEINEQFLGRT